MKVAWFSCGVTSAVMCKKLVQENDVEFEIVYEDTGSEHESNKSFLSDCSSWIGREIKTIRSPFFKDHWDVIERIRYVNGPSGAACTRKLKREVRTQYEYASEIAGDKVTGHFYGFDSGEAKRAKSFIERNPGSYFPLLRLGISKEECFSIITDAGIELPKMYQLGYGHNNCIGCVKGGKGYWNKIRIDFPEAFEKMLGLEESIGRSCIKGCFLKDLKPKEIGGEAISCGPDCKAYQDDLLFGLK